MSLVAAPEVPFEELDRVLDGAGWFLEWESQEPPLIPGEPELCVYTHREADARLTYTFNPLVALRVLAFDGRDAVAAELTVARQIARLDDAALRRLLGAAAPGELLLGIWAARELGAGHLLAEIDRLRAHADAGVARAATEAREALRPPELAAVREALAAAKRAAGERSVVFAHLGDAETRRQVLRWLLHDCPRATPPVDEALRAGLADPDDEVRATARAVAERFAARAAGALDDAAARAPRDDRTLLEHALTTPLGAAPAPAALPPAVVDDGAGGYRLRRSGLALRFVAPVEHWLGEGSAVRRATSPGFFVARLPVTAALARWAVGGRQGPTRVASGETGAPRPCARDEARAICAALARIEDAAIRLPSADEWEMAARGPDGRRLPWGNFEAGGDAPGPSPWGCERMVGHGPEWTADDVVCGAPRVLPCARRAPAAAIALAAVRPIVALRTSATPDDDDGQAPDPT
jgi:formylglycine-generating enzyme required for sulfatase activity